MLIPLLYWGAAALVSKGCATDRQGATLSLGRALLLIIVNPVFTSSMNSVPAQEQGRCARAS